MNGVKHVQPVPKRKKGAPQRQSLHDALECLSHESMQGFLDGSTIWILPTVSVSTLLDDCCLGTPCSSAAMKEDITRLVQTCFPINDEGDRTASLLRLSLEEGFFLAYALEILTIHNVHEDTLIGPVGLQSSTHILLPGAMADLLQLAVYLLAQLHRLSPLSQQDKKPLLWTDLQVCNRLSSQVGKELVLLYISYPPQADFTALVVLDNIQVEERLVSRWIPEKEMTRV